jgi:hypothetical protein
MVGVTKAIIIAISGRVFDGINRRFLPEGFYKSLVNESGGG